MGLSDYGWFLKNFSWPRSPSQGLRGFSWQLAFLHVVGPSDYGRFLKNFPWHRSPSWNLRGFSWQLAFLHVGESNDYGWFLKNFSWHRSPFWSLRGFSWQLAFLHVVEPNDYGVFFITQLTLPLQWHQKSYGYFQRILSHTRSFIEQQSYPFPNISLHKFFNCFIQSINCFLIIFFYCFYNAMIQMIL